MKKKKSEKDSQQSTEASGTLTVEKLQEAVDKLYDTITTNQNSFGVSKVSNGGIIEYKGPMPSDFAYEIDAIREREKVKKEAEAELLKNKKQVFKDYGLKWDDGIVRMIEHRYMWGVTSYYFAVPETTPPKWWIDEVEKLSKYVRKHTKLGDIL